MPEISDAELRNLMTYQILGSPTEVSKKIKDLETDNHEQREKLREATSKIPKDGEVVLPKAEAETLTAYKALGKPEEIKASLESGTKATGELALKTKREAVLPFLKAAGLAEESADTLLAIPELREATFEVRKGKVAGPNGTQVDGDVAYLKLPGENAQAMQFSEATEKVPSLKGLKTAGPATETPARVQFIKSGGTSGAPGNVFDEIRASRTAATTPDPSQPAVKPITERIGFTQPAQR